MKKLYLLICIFLGIGPLKASPLLVMIDPAGHSKDTGRKLHQGYERAETYQWAEALKKGLESQLSYVRVILTRAPGDEIVDLQNASFANRRKVNLFIRLQLYPEASEKPQLHLYYHLMDPLIDGIKKTTEPFLFIPIHQAHFAALGTSKYYATQLQSFFSAPSIIKQLDCHATLGLPLKPLTGIQAPALLLELGVHHDHDWSLALEYLVQGIASLLTLPT
jgi:N-acetylmuramoyl-L-alanine amidase